MTRRFWLAVVLSAMAIGSPSGCGLALRRIEGEPAMPPGTARRNFDSPTQRVAFATLEAMRAELASSDFAAGQDNAFRPVEESAKSDSPTTGDAAFWLSWTTDAVGSTGKQRVILLASHFDGKTRDGRAVHVAVLFRDRAERSQVTVQVDPPGDPEIGRILLDRIADRLKRPTYPHRSPEEAAALQSFFGSVSSREALPTLRKTVSSK